MGSEKLKHVAHCCMALKFLFDVTLCFVFYCRKHNGMNHNKNNLTNFTYDAAQFE
jgi:hypothetical protein